MNDGERRRYFAGRHDWREHRWEDHCGEPGCEESGCRDNYIPEGNARLAEDRCRFAESILGYQPPLQHGRYRNDAPRLTSVREINPRSVGSRS